MKFIRRNWSKYSKLGKKRKKKQTWRRATGRDNKIREKRRGYPVKVMIGFKKKKDNKKIKLIKNLKDIEKISKEETAMIGKVGEKKRIEILKKAKEKGIVIYNLNVKKILKKAEREEEMKKKQKEEEKTEKEKSKNKKEKEKKK